METKVRFGRGKESEIKKTSPVDGKLYFATDTGTLWLGNGSQLLQIKDNIIPEIPEASQSKSGLMSKEDKVKLDGMKVKEVSFAASQTSGDVVGTLSINGQPQTLYSKKSITYSLTQDPRDPHTLVFTPSSGPATSIKMPDENTTYTSLPNPHSLTIECGKTYHYNGSSAVSLEALPMSTIAIGPTEDSTEDFTLFWIKTKN